MKAQVRFIFLYLSISVLLQGCKPPSDVEPCFGFATTIIQQGSNVLIAQTDYGSVPITYQWSNGVTLSETTVSSSGIYTVTVRDGLGCTVTASYNYTYTAGCSPSTVNDADGNTYDVVTIGSQCWMGQNLRVSAGIAQVTDSATWVSTTNPAWCYYANNPVNAAYGKLYNWYAVQSGNLCPAGWHIPTEADWQQLETYLNTQQGGKIKSTSGWDSPNTGATNSSGFTAVASGYRSYLSSQFYGLNQSTGFWASTQAGSNTAYSRGVSYDSEWLTNLQVNKRQGYSCRCIKD